MRDETATDAEGAARRADDELPRVHVGYPKTATSFLQSQILGRADLGVEHAAGAQTRPLLIARIVLADGFAFDAASVGAELRAAEAPARARGAIPVWSDETLLGDPIARRYDGPANVERLACVFPGARLLVTIREQRSAALSLHAEYVRHGGMLPLESFVGTGREELSFTSLLRPEFLFYDRAIARLQALFGAERVYVLPIELLRADPTEYFKRLSAFLGRKIAPPERAAVVHASEGRTARALRRRLNALMQRDPLRPGLRGVALLADRTVRLADRFFPAAADGRLHAVDTRLVDARYGSSYAESNARTAELTGLPLRDLGYPT